MLGSYEGDDARFDRWCPTVRLVGVSVEYRLAPETPYPGPLDDCYAGLRWVHDHAAELGVDPDRIGIGGPSAGGNLAAGLGLLARDRAEVPLTYQLLIYPMLDDRQITASSRWPRPDLAAERQHVRLDGATSATLTAAATCRRTPRRRGRPTSPACRRRSSRSAPSTASPTRTSTTPCACATPACRPSCMFLPGLAARRARLRSADRRVLEADRY